MARFLIEVPREESATRVATSRDLRLGPVCRVACDLAQPRTGGDNYGPLSTELAS